MTLETLKPLLNSELVSPETRNEISEEWEKKVKEIRAEVTEEVRAEMASRYAHDKNQIVEAMGQMIEDAITKEVSQIVKEKRGIEQDRARYLARLKNVSEDFERFLTSELTEKFREIHNENRIRNNAIRKMAGYIESQVKNELEEFQADVQDVADTKVRLVKEARSKVEDWKRKFVVESARKVETYISRTIAEELGELSRDIQEAKANMFGRRIFETFKAEFADTCLNENEEFRNLKRRNAQMTEQLRKASAIVRKNRQIIEKKDREVKAVTENAERSRVMNELLSPLKRDKQDLMRELLEDRPTPELKAAFKRYLPGVLKSETAARKSLVENRKNKKFPGSGLREVTGDRLRIPVEDRKTNVIELNELGRLAGLE